MGDDVDFIWATGGHSAAAGHGNLYNESYTAFLGRDLLQVLPRIGWNVETRNYAMGGMASAPEVALCAEQIFGNDFDFLSWDYGMTDGGSTDILLYLWRANLVGNHPILFLVNGKGKDSRFKILEDLGGAGYKSDQDLLKNVPVTTPDNIDSLPRFVQYLKCMEGEKEVVETGNNICGPHKYSEELCVNRPYKASWHPGL